MGWRGAFRSVSSPCLLCICLSLSSQRGTCSSSKTKKKNKKTGGLKCFASNGPPRCENAARGPPTKRREREQKKKGDAEAMRESDSRSGLRKPKRGFCKTPAVCMHAPSPSRKCLPSPSPPTSRVATTCGPAIKCRRTRRSAAPDPRAREAGEGQRRGAAACRRRPPRLFFFFLFFFFLMS